MQAARQAELDRVVDALGEFYARETYLLDKDLGERTLTPAGGVPRKPVCGLGRRLRLQPARRAPAAVAQGIDRLHR